MTTRTTKRPAGEPTWIDLATSNLEGAKQFYQQIFGWDYFDTGADFGTYTMAMLRGLNVAGIGPIWPPDAPTPSAWTIYFASDDAVADTARVKELGGAVMVDAMAISDSGVMAVCADPTGAVFGLWQANTHIGAAIDNEHGAMAWFEVNTRDAAAAREFYANLLHVTTHRMDSDDAEYYTLNRGEEMLAGILQMDANWEGIPPHWMGYFTVDNTDETINQAIAAGGKLMVPAFDIPYGRMAVLSDPFSATFSIIQPPA